jgi:hypothetical protein
VWTGVAMAVLPIVPASCGTNLKENHCPPPPPLRRVQRHFEFLCHEHVLCNGSRWTRGRLTALPGAFGSGQTPPAARATAAFVRPPVTTGTKRPAVTACLAAPTAAGPAPLFAWRPTAARRSTSSRCAHATMMQVGWWLQRSSARTPEYASAV